MKTVSNVKRILAIALSLALMCGMVFTGAVMPVSAENENAQVKTFDVDFADLTALVDADKFDTATGLYQSTADDTAINEWINARFGVFVNRESSMHKPKAYLGQPSFSVIGFESGWSDNWGGEINLKITNDGYLHHTSTKVGDQQLRKSHTFTVKNPQGDFAELANFEAEMVFNQAGTSPTGSFFISFHEQTPGRMWRHNSTFVGTSGNEAVIIGYMNSSTPSGNGIIVGNIANTNTKTGYTAFAEELTKTDDYKLTVKVVGTALTATVTKVADGSVVYTGSNTIAAGSGALSFGLGNSAKSLKSVKVTALDENGNPVDFGTTRSMQDFSWTLTQKGWYKSSKYYTNNATQTSFNYYNFVNSTSGNAETTETAQAIIGALEAQFDSYHNKEGIYNASVFGNKVNFEGQTADYMYFRTAYLDEWLQMTSASRGGSEMMRHIYSVSPKGMDGNKFLVKNFETTFEVRFNDSNNSSAFVFGFRQKTPGKFLNQYYNINKEQGLVVVNNSGYNFAAGTQIVNSKTDSTQDMYKYTLNSFDTAVANGTMLAITVKVVGDQATLKIVNKGSNGSGNTVLVNETKTIPYTEAGYLAYGISHKSGDLGDITLTHLDDNGNKMSLYEHTAAEYSSLAVGRDIDFINIPGAEYANGKYTANNKEYAYFTSFDDSVLEDVLSDVKMVYNNGAEYTVRSAALSGKGTWLLYNNRWFQLGSSPTGGANRMTNINALIPLDEGGAAQKVTNSTTRFVFRTENSTKTILLGLRQDVPGKFMTGDTEINKNQVLVAITSKSIKVAGGNDINYADFALGYTEEEGTNVWGEYETAFATAIATNKHLVVETSLIGNTLKITLYTEQVNGAARIDIYEGTFTVNYGEAGYTAIATANGGGNVADISVDALDANGYRVDYPNCEHKYDCSADQFCNVCGGDKVAVGEHDYATTEYDENGHWGVCACGAKGDVEAHVYDNDKDTTCDCGYVREIVHVCDFATAKYDENNHWNECECGEKANVEAHVFDSDCDTTCDCGYTREITHNYATPKFDAENHWNECACGEKADVTPHTITDKHNEEGHWTACDCGYATAMNAHELGYVADGDQHYQTCACGYATEKENHSFGEDNMCACGAQAPNSAAVADRIITLNLEEGYELKAGSLIVTDMNGNKFVPQRVGYRNDGDGYQFEIPADAEGPFTVEYAVIQPQGGTGEKDNGVNMGVIGTQTTDTATYGGGLRFIHRVNITTEQDGKMYINYNGEKLEVAEYGLLLASQAVLKNPEDLDIETALESKHVKMYSWPEKNVYFDNCSNYVDIAVHVTNIAAVGGQNVNIITRTYVKLANGQVYYGAVAVENYANASK